MLMERIVLGSFQYHPEQKPTWLDSVKVYNPDGTRWPQDKEEYPTAGVPLDRPLKFEFEGNRIVLLGAPVPDGSKPGTAQVLIDGKSPSAIPAIYTATRSTVTTPSGHWPFVYRVQPGGQPVAEDWTLTFTKVTTQKAPKGKPDDYDIDFEVKGSVTGPDGVGNMREKFVSNSGRIMLEPDWFLKSYHMHAARFTPTVGFEVKWKARPMGLDVWKQTAGVDPATEDRYVLAQGLSNTKHTLELIPNGDGPLGLRAIVVYQPRQAEISHPATTGEAK
jgi:hypothetical protein